MNIFHHKIFTSPKFIICSILLILGAAILIGLSQPLFFQKKENEQLLLTQYSNDEATQESQQSKVLNEKTTEEQMIYVDVKGAVHQPGMYAFTPKDRVFDVIQKAGGLTETADEKQINFAAKIKDQQLLYVPEKGEETEFSSVQEGSAETTDHEEQSEKINLNTADLLQLQQIPGIGEKKAQDILHYRQENGLFKTLEELQEISGIGQKTVEKIKNFVTITIE